MTRYEVSSISGQDSEGFSAAIHRCSAAALKSLLEPTLPHVWIDGHRPRRQIEWQRAKVPLTSGTTYELLTRNLTFDLQLSTEDFIGLLPEFEDSGMVLLQSSRAIPNALEIQKLLTNPSRWRILQQNGVELMFDLPHKHETAVVSSPDRALLERALNRVMDTNIQL
jgi:hypothetical protein